MTRAALRAHHFDCGTTCPCQVPFLPSVSLPTRVTLLETAEGPVLVDAGYARGYLESPKKDPVRWMLLRPKPGAHQAACERIRAAGLAPSEVRHVVLTHLDFDHASGVRDFPAARIYVPESELGRAREPRNAVERYRYRDTAALLSGREVVALAPRGGSGRPPPTGAPGDDAESGLEATLSPLAASCAPLPGLSDALRVVSLPGHTEGHVGVAWRDAEGMHVHAGDALFDVRELDPGASPPLVAKLAQALHGDAREAGRSRRTLARLREAGLRIYCSHDPRFPEDAT